MPAPPRAKRTYGRYGHVLGNPRRGGTQPHGIRLRSSKAGREYRGLAVFMLAVLACSFFFVNISGQIYPAEVVLVGYVLHRAVSGTFVQAEIPPWIFVTLLLWAVGSLLSDYVAAGEPLQLFRGLARTFFLFADLTAIWLMVDRERKLIHYAWIGLCVSAPLSYILQPSLYAHAAPWKFVFGLPVTILVILAVGSPKFPARFSIPAVIFLAGLHFVMGFRSMAVTTLIVALILVIRVRQRGGLKHGAAKIRSLFLVAAGVAVIYALVTSYDQLATQGLFGYSAQQKAYYLSGEYGSLLSSRSEFFLSTGTILKQPLFGGGSFSSASAEVTESTASLFHNLGYEHIAPEILANSPAYHSEILAAWAENGFLAVPFWLGVFIIFFRGLNCVINGACASPALVAFLSLQGLWDLFFSPFGAGQRMFVCLSVVTVFVLSSPRKETGTNASYFRRNNQLQPARLPH